MCNISKEERDLLKEAGKWSFWDTVFGRYEDIFVFILALIFLAFLIWTEVEHELFSYVLRLKSMINDWS